MIHDKKYLSVEFKRLFFYTVLVCIVALVAYISIFVRW